MTGLRRLTLVPVLVLVACGAQGASFRLGRAELTIFGAASLSPLLDAARATYVPSRFYRHGLVLAISTGSSAALRTQIEQGAPADVFLSADLTNPQLVVDAGLADGGAVRFAANELAIVVPADNPGGIVTPADLARDGVRIIAAGDEVPITAYAAACVANLGALPGYAAGFAASYEANIVTREDSVRSILAKIELGEGDAGIVYRTDAVASGEVMSVAIPEDANVAVTYAGIVVKASDNREEAHAFLDWLAGPEGQAILAEFGFLPPTPP
ncbi:MAG: molybdate ABC transporter substrate-binding protein [Chloroflexi bacterium]|nr:molybdate ABC transporter substrate-binding protein [Chloroflexota bacterium]